MKNNGFSLVEVLVAVALVGVAIVALVAANSVFTQNNSAALDMSTAEYLIEQIRELTMQALPPLTGMLPVVDPEVGTEFATKEGSPAAYDDVEDFDNETFSPPINADRQQLGVFSGFAQKVTVQKVNAADFQQVVADNPVPDSPFVRITVDIYHHGYLLSSESWIRAKY
jgi:prepilin-type N-terminal cleavage/methylation domain-containing protein